MGRTVKNCPLMASVPPLPHGLIHRATPATTTMPISGRIHQAKVLRPVYDTGTKAVGFIDITYLPIFTCTADMVGRFLLPNPTLSTISILGGSNCWPVNLPDPSPAPRS